MSEAAALTVVDAQHLPPATGQTGQGMYLTISHDVSALQNKINMLERELEIEKRARELAERERENMRYKYVDDLEQREKEHRKKIKEMEEEVHTLKKELADSTEAHRKEMAELRADINGMKGEIAQHKRQHARLLCGSVAYVYINSAGMVLTFMSCSPFSFISPSNSLAFCS